MCGYDQAIAHAIDRNLIVEALLKRLRPRGGRAVDLSQFRLGGRLEKLRLPTILRRPRHLLEEAGIAPGTKVRYHGGRFSISAWCRRSPANRWPMLGWTREDLPARRTGRPVCDCARGIPDEAGDVRLLLAGRPLFHSSSQWAKLTVAPRWMPRWKRRALRSIPPSVWRSIAECWRRCTPTRTSGAALPGRDDVRCPQGRFPADSGTGSLLPDGHRLDPVTASRRSSAMPSRPRVSRGIRRHAGSAAGTR